MHPGPLDGAPLRGGAAERGSRSVLFRIGDFSKPRDGPTGDDGCTGVAEEGNASHPTKERASFTRSPGPRSQDRR